MAPTFEFIQLSDAMLHPYLTVANLETMVMMLLPQSMRLSCIPGT